MPGHFEAKKHAYRQTQDGIVVSFVIHPNDVDAGFATANLGTRYMVAFAEIGDDGRPLPNGATVAGSADRINGHEPDRNGSGGGKPSKVVTAGETATKDRKPFASLPLSQQAALKCNDASFRDWLTSITPGIHGEWPPEVTADILRERLKIASRAELDNLSNVEARFRWTNMLMDFEAWLTTRQYAASVR